MYSTNIDEMMKESDTQEGQQEEQAQISLSLCAHLTTPKMTEEELVQTFNDNIVSFDYFSSDPYEVLNDPHLLIKIYDKLYTPEDGIPQVISLLTFNKFLPTEKMKDKPFGQELSPTKPSNNSSSNQNLLSPDKKSSSKSRKIDAQSNKSTSKSSRFQG